MLSYKTFKVSDEKGINDFLAEWSKNLAGDGIVYVGERVCYTYNTEDAPERDRNILMEGMKQGRMKNLMTAAAHEVDQRYHRGQAAKGVKGADTEVVKACNNRDSQLAQAYYTQQLIDLVEHGEWPEEMKDSNDEV